MGQSYVGEMRIFAGNFAPVDWMFCEGQLVSITDYDALFSLIGTTYGGDGVKTFALPDMRGRISLHIGQSPGLPNYVMGQKGGVETVTLTVATMPSHTHPYNASTNAGTGPTPVGAVAASSNTVKIYKAAAPATPMDANSLAATGGNQPHDNVQPYICINYIISMVGIYPTKP